MMDNEIFLNERIEVVATFGDGLELCVPQKFRRANGQVVTVSEVGLRHPTQAGRRTLHVFEITDGQTEYRLEFNTERATWHLTREALYE